MAFSLNNAEEEDDEEERIKTRYRRENTRKCRLFRRANISENKNMQPATGANRWVTLRLQQPDLPVNLSLDKSWGKGHVV